MDKDKLINMIHLAKEMPELTFIFRDSIEYDLHAERLFLYSLEKNDMTVLEWLMQATHVGKDFRFDETQQEIVLSAIQMNKIQWIETYLSNFNKFVRAGEKMTENMTENMYEFFPRHFKDISEELQQVITQNMFSQYVKDKFLRQPVHEWMEKVIETHQNDKFELLYAQLSQTISQSKMNELNEHAFLNSITYANRCIFTTLLPKMESYLKEEYTEETLTIRFGLSQHVQVLEWLKDVGLDLSNPLTQEDLIFSTLNAGGCELLEELYTRGARFYHADQKQERWEHKLTLFEDLSDREDKELHLLTQMMLKYEPENLPLLLENLQDSVYTQGAKIAQTIMLHSKMQEQLEQKPMKKQIKI